jgi:2',3'-cyclic-nucleotide 2'-phosphodiesterase (5'-nucleotidase family)
MKIINRLISLCFALYIISCSTPQQATTSSKVVSNYNKKDGKVEWIFLQLNDVYEISPIENGKAGGLARVATIKQRLLNENPNVFTVMAGDFLSPSVIGTLKYEGKGIKGRQMVDVMNALGVNLVCFGNHEFDLDYIDLQARLDESKFDWVSSNAFKVEGESIANFSRSGHDDYFEEYKILTINDGTTGESAKVGIWGVVLPANKKDYVQYSDIFERSNTLIEDILKKEANVIVGLTHVSIDEDKQIAQQNPSITLIMGGHEHNNMKHQVGKTIITKADANAKTVWIHRCSYDIAAKTTAIKSELVKIDDSIADDPSVGAVVKKWTDIAENAFKSGGFNPNEVVATTKEAFDGREATVRLTQTNLGKAIALSMVKAAKKPVDCAFFNSGSIRIDDQVSGKITQNDIVRILPFGGKIIELDIVGSELKKVILAGLLSKGRGGYLQWANISYEDASKTISINNSPISDSKTYHIATNDFLFSGKENNFDFFTANNPNITNVEQPNASDPMDLRNDIRKAFIDYLKKQN